MLNYVQKQERSTRVGRVDFGILSADEIQRMSVVRVSDVNIYHRGKPQVNGINDHRMGTVDRRLLCGTCGCDVRFCPGHTGYINLPLPCFHIGYIEQTVKILRSTCFFCCRLSMSSDEMDTLMVEHEESKSRFTAAYSLAKMKKKCPHCKAPKPTYTRVAAGVKLDWGAADGCEFESDEERVFANKAFTAQSAFSIMNCINDGDAQALGFKTAMCHPRDLITRSVLVPPPIARPAIMASEGSRARGQDDITHKLQDINKRCIEIRGMLPQDNLAIDSLSSELMEKWSKLQIEVYSYVSNNIRGQKTTAQRNMGVTKSIVDRLKGKDGRVRGNLMGKRVNFSARSVITPDPIMDVDQVGVPYKIAKSLTVPERITPSNICEMRERVLNGCKSVHGAECIITSDNQVIQLDSCEDRSQIRLQYGWVVERFLKNDDYVIFNRQPSLHRMGMMGHRVVLVSGSTFRLNLSVANPYNADFDGDEMNMHVPQSACSIAEVANIMAVPCQIISPQANKPCIGIVQDTLLGSYLATRPGVFITKNDMMNYISWVKYPHHNYELPTPAICKPVELWTGSQLFSMLLPRTMMLTRCRDASAIAVPGEGDVLIRKGVLLYGHLGKATLGSSANGIIDVMFRDFGSLQTIRFTGDVQRVINQWLMKRGFSVGISDCVLDEKGQEEIKERIDNGFVNCEAILNENIPSSMQSEAEGTVGRILSKLLMQTGDSVQSHLHENSIAAMVKAGSKGNPINLSQICGCVGQQSVEGKRIIPESASRTLSCFALDEKSINANGFVQNSYCLGLEPHEYFFHAMGGREGLVDTAVKTATTGYIQRRQMKAMEDNRAAYDATVRNAQATIIQFVYGGDGCDPCRVEKQRLHCITDGEETLRGFVCEDMATGVQCTELERLLQRCERVRIGKLSSITPSIDPTVLLPVNMYRLLSNWQHDDGAVVSEEEAHRIVSDLVEDLQRETPGYCECLCASICYYLCSKNLRSHNFSKDSTVAICKEILNRSLSAIVAAGEMVGAIAAQSLGEPCTQMTLNSFHYSGVANVGMTMGIPRLKEILDFTKRIKTPICTLRLKTPHCYSAAYAESLSQVLPVLKLSDVVKSMELVFDQDFENTTVGDDQLAVTMDLYFGKIPKGASNWMSRLVLKKDELRRYSLDPPTLAGIIKTRMPGKVHVISSEVNSGEWWIRCRYFNMREMVDKGFKNHANDMERNLAHRVTLMMMEQLRLTGHSGIRSSGVTEIEVWNASELRNEKQYAISVRGNVLNSISCIPSVDWSRSITNDVGEALELFGIEAANAVIYSETKNTVSYDGTYVDPRHLMMIADTMTYRGFVMPISRHGINRTNTGPLVRCSFEETADVLYDAAMFGEIDDARGVTQNIMTGQVSSIGTGAFDLMVPDWSLPPSAQGKTEKRERLVKTTVNRRTNDLDRAPAAIEYLDANIWSRKASGETVNEMPFVQETATGELDETINSDGNRHYVTVTKDSTEEGETDNFEFIPSSPQRSVQVVIPAHHGR
tara:strand:+ start:3062 stop:7594 length:4533 start_codon:yes stop_codon:yes gene_type:complete